MTRPDRFRGAMLGLALGDALGAPYEGGDPRTVEPVLRTSRFGTTPGQPGEDSTLALFAAQAVLMDGAGWADGYVRRLVGWAASAPPELGEQTRRAAQCWKSGAPPDEDPAATDNGSLMAVTPVVLGLDRDAAVEFAGLTHPSPEARAANARFADTLLGQLADAIPPSPEGATTESAPAGAAAARIASPAADSCGLCLDLALLTLARAVEGGDPFAALVDLVGEGGDSGTNAAVAGALLGARFGVKAWPPRLLAGLHLAMAMTAVADGLCARPSRPVS